jgi:acetyl esterase/lipase
VTAAYSPSVRIGISQVSSDPHDQPIERGRRASKLPPSGRTKVGVIGFSAGGHLAAAVSTRFAQRTYPPVDAADELSCRPDFAIVLYPGHLWTPGTDLSLRPDIRVRADTPPTFLLHAEHDQVDDVKHSLAYYVALQKAGVPTEMHLYAQGGHAFGLRPTKLPIGRWPALVEQWLHTMGMLSPQEGG